MPVLRPIILSYPTAGPSGSYTAAATYLFMTSDYAPPSTGRSVSVDVVHNRNGAFKYVYDNGPNFNRWNPFRIVMENAFATVLGVTATVQYQRLLTMWNHKGQMQLSAPDGIYSVYWAPGNELTREFRAGFPTKVGDKIEYAVTVQFEQA